MKYSFPLGKSKFKCVQCGKCCYPGALSLTPTDSQEISQHPESKSQLIDFQNSPFSHALVCKGKCPFLSEGMQCNIYEKRPAVCVSFPLTFSFKPDGEMLVNYIKCEGDGVDDGEIVDERFVQKTIREIEKRNPNFFRELEQQKVLPHQLLLPFYSNDDLTDFDSKQQLKTKLAEMLLFYVRDGQNFRASSQAFLTIAKDTIASSLIRIRGRSHRTRSIIFKDHVDEIQTRIAKALESDYERLKSEYVNLIRNKEEEAVKSGKCMIFWDGEVRKIALDAALESKDLTGTIRTVKASHVFIKRTFSAGAFLIMLRHLHEILVRIDLGGFPMDAPIEIMFETLAEYVNNLETTCYIYSEEEEVPEDVARDVTNDLDTFFVLGALYLTRAGLEKQVFR